MNGTQKVMVRRRKKLRRLLEAAGISQSSAAWEIAWDLLPEWHLTRQELVDAAQALAR